MKKARYGAPLTSCSSMLPGLAPLPFSSSNATSTLSTSEKHPSCVGSPPFCVRPISMSSRASTARGCARRFEQRGGIRMLVHSTERPRSSRPSMQSFPLVQRQVIATPTWAVCTSSPLSSLRHEVGFVSPRWSKRALPLSMAKSGSSFTHSGVNRYGGRVMISSRATAWCAIPRRA